MKRSRFAEEQIISILKEHQAGCAPLVHMNMYCRAMDELLKEHLLDTLRHARSLMAVWSDDFNITARTPAWRPCTPEIC